MNIVARLSKIALYTVVLFCLAYLYQSAAFGIGLVDPTFNAVPSKTLESAPLNYGNLTIQPDGKIIVFGSFRVVNGVAKNGIARLNTDGSLDNSFDCGACNFRIDSAVVQPDGKIVVAGSTVRRLNADGSLDSSFTSSFTNDQFSSYSVWAIQPDGKIIILNRAVFAGFTSFNIYRLNPDGTFDSTFTVIMFSTGRTSYQYVTKIFLTPDGKILVSGSSVGFISFGFLYRFNSDGTRDMTFDPPALLNPFTNSTVIDDFDVQSDGSIVFVGVFTAVNGVDRTGIAKLLPAGNVDLSFVPTGIGGGDKVKILPNGQSIVKAGNTLYRLNTNGSVDNTFNPPSIFNLENFTIDSAGRIILFGSFIENGIEVYKYVRLNADGSLDNSFNSRVEAVGSISALALQPDGKIVIGGNFSRINGLARNRLARLNADGTTDASFDVGSGFDNNINKIVIQADGKILVGGNFNNFNGVQRVALVRLNSNGSLDSGFNPVLEANNSVISAIAVQPDGKILIGGSFATINGMNRTSFVRLNSDGSVDSGFNAMLGNASIVRSILVQPDGKIVIGGSFSGINGFNRGNLVRLNADGSLDAAFNAGNIAFVNQVEIQPGGKYLVLTNTLSRLNNDGSADSSFQTLTLTSGGILSFVVQADGSIIIGGDFVTSVNSRARLARLNADGSLDLLFIPTGTDNTVRAIVQQLDQRVIIGGDFTRVDQVTRIGIARLIVPATPPPSRGVLFDFDGDGRADISVFRPSSNFWYRLNSTDNSFFQQSFGTGADLLAPADYDGDGRTDLAYWRPGAGNVAAFYIFESSTNTVRTEVFAQTGDVPVSGDWDGDGRADVAVYREAVTSGAQSYFFYRPSSQPAVDFVTVPWGTMGDKPVRGDFNGDERQDAAVFRPSAGAWYVLQSGTNQISAVQWGTNGDVPTPADYDGDGKTDISVFRPSTGAWYQINSSTAQYSGVQFGQSGDIPVAADYDGDNKADVAVFRPSTGSWYLNQSTQGFAGVQFGVNGDLPVEAAFVR